MPNVQKKTARLTPSTRHKSAADKLVDGFGQLVDDAAEKMTDGELRQAEQNFNAAVNRAVASHKQRRETA